MREEKRGKMRERPQERHGEEGEEMGGGRGKGRREKKGEEGEERGGGRGRRRREREMFKKRRLESRNVGTLVGAGSSELVTVILTFLRSSLSAICFTKVLGFTVKDDCMENKLHSNQQ